MHLEVLGDKAQEIFNKLKNFPSFYLVGGTALALQIGHRISVDFDLFSTDSIPRSLYLKVEEIFKENKIDIIVNNSENLTILVDGVQLTFFHYPFEVITSFITFENVNILPVAELGALKAYALGRRATFKDYVDLYYILSKKLVLLDEIIDLSEKKYKDKFDKRLFLEQLIYLEDIKDIEIKYLGEIITKKEMIDYFTGLVKEVKL